MIARLPETYQNEKRAGSPHRPVRIARSSRSGRERRAGPEWADLSPFALRRPL
jgi:hypothetical protein